MLGHGRGTQFYFTVDNWAANPSATPGTSITPGTSNAEGSWTQVISSASVTTDCYAIYLQCYGGGTSTAAKNQFIDIGIDPAGGTSYTPIISDLVCGASPSLTQAGNREWFFWYVIPAGSTVAVRIQGSNATAGTVGVLMRLYGQPSNAEYCPKGLYSETLGAGASTLGTSFTPGNAADGSWASLGTTTRDLWWWQIGYQINNGTITAEYTYIDLAYGDANNKVVMMRILHGGTTSETCGLAAQTQLCQAAAYNFVPAGSIIYVRGRCQNAPDTGYNANAIGIGGE